MSKETWEMAVGFSGYDVSTRGRLRSYWQQRATASGIDRGAKPVVMTPSKDKDGRLFAILRLPGGKKKNAALARVVLATFKEPGGKRDKVGYKDGKRSNIAPSNLFWIKGKTRSAEVVAKSMKAKAAKAGIKLSAKAKVIAKPKPSPTAKIMRKVAKASGLKLKAVAVKKGKKSDASKRPAARRAA